MSRFAIREMHFITNGQAAIVPVEISQGKCVPKVKEEETSSDTKLRNEEVSSTVSPFFDRFRGKGSHVGAPLVLAPNHVKLILKQEVVMDSTYIVCVNRLTSHSSNPYDDVDATFISAKKMNFNCPIAGEIVLSCLTCSNVMIKPRTGDLPRKT